MAYRIKNGLLEADTAQEILELHHLLHTQVTSPMIVAVADAMAEAVAPVEAKRRHRKHKEVLAERHGVTVGQVWTHRYNKRTVQVRSLTSKHVIPKVLESDKEQPHARPITYKAFLDNYKLVKNVDKAPKPKAAKQPFRPKVGQIYESRNASTKKRTIKIARLEGGRAVPEIINSDSKKPLRRPISFQMLKLQYRLVSEPKS